MSFRSRVPPGRRWLAHLPQLRRAAPRPVATRQFQAWQSRPLRGAGTLSRSKASIKIGAQRTLFLSTKRRRISSCVGADCVGCSAKRSNNAPSPPARSAASTPFAPKALKNSSSRSSRHTKNPASAMPEAPSRLSPPAVNTPLQVDSSSASQRPPSGMSKPAHPKSEKNVLKVPAPSREIMLRPSASRFLPSLSASARIAA